MPPIRPGDTPTTSRQTGALLICFPDINSLCRGWGREALFRMLPLKKESLNYGAAESSSLPHRETLQFRVMAPGVMEAPV
jgi:hypothetical protein